MRSFEYYTPTKVIFGKDTHTRAGELAREYGATKVLVHYGSERVRESGLLDEIFHSLEEAGLSYVSLGA